MSYDPEFVTRLLVGNFGYVLLVISMMMTCMLLLRLFGLASGLVGAAYMWFWLHDPVGLGWESIFAGACAFQIALTAYRNRATRFNDDERTLQAELMPDLEPRHVRALLRVGSWHSAEPGTGLLRQGEHARHLIFLKSGKAAVLVDGRRVGTCGTGNLVGETGFLRAEPANATVITESCVRYFAMDRDRLRRTMKSCPEIATLIGHCTRKDVENKLAEMNAAMVEALAIAVSGREACGLVRHSRRPRGRALCNGRSALLGLVQRERIALH